MRILFGGPFLLVASALLLVLTIAGCGAVDRPAARARPVLRARQGVSLTAGIELAEGIIDNPASSSSRLAQAGVFEQLATGALARQRRQTRRAVLASLTAPAAAAVRADLDAAAALGRLTTPVRGLPHWRIVQPPAPDTLLRYLRTAGARYRVPWEDLAAIELVETRFGRVHGLSSAGAEGPMQFLPGTWARYGSGDVNDQRDAILAAARFLAANGARRDMAGAMYRYNNSGDYVRAVEDYARRMRTDARAYYGYYEWQVLYAKVGGAVILPVGYPRARPMRPSLPSLG